jgi:endoglycosylceramidase
MKLSAVKFALIIIVLSCSAAACKKDKSSGSENKPLYATRGSEPGFYDTQGRWMILRGVNYNVLGDYWQANPSVPATKAYSEQDIKMMASYGFNCIRLLFSWSSLEPQKGVYSEVYIQRINQVIQEAAKYDIYVMLDMHQDAWGKYIATPADSSCAYPNKGWDGAPQWATITGGTSTCTTDGAREKAPAVYFAFQNFWDNTNNIQDACIAAWQHLVSATSSNANVLGYDLLNEPGLGYKSPTQNEVAKLAAYYGRLITAIRSAEGVTGNRHIVFIENSITRSGDPYIGIPDPSFTADGNIAAAPHHYFESIGNLPFTLEEGYDILKSVTADYQAPFLVGEWGFFGNTATDVQKVKRFGVVEDQNFGSSTWWQWAQAPGDPHGISWDGNTYSSTSLHLIELDASGNFTGKVNEPYLQVLSRSRPYAIFGKPSVLTSNSDNGEMHLEAIAGNEGVTDLWVPGRFGPPKITGTNVSLKQLVPVDGGYKVYVNVSGAYTINVGF